MAQTLSEPPRLRLAVLLVVGALAAGGALWLGDHRSAVRDSGILIAILMGTYFVCWSWALFQYLRWRDRRPTVAAARPTYPDELEGTIYGLAPGGEYRVMQPFTDYYGNEFKGGELLRFRERHFLPYDGGHTIVFDERPLYLQETRNEAILAHFSEYIARIER
ncbi:MAG TPA: DUF3601 domain-containing protein [Blastocatellia bacterium]|nr:DUF3601 domain-containing protein [Blastocatellia bacterium]